MNHNSYCRLFSMWFAQNAHNCVDLVRYVSSTHNNYQKHIHTNPNQTEAESAKQWAICVCVSDDDSSEARLPCLVIADGVRMEFIKFTQPCSMLCHWSISIRKSDHHKLYMSGRGKGAVIAFHVYSKCSVLFCVPSNKAMKWNALNDEQQYMLCVFRFDGCRCQWNVYRICVWWCRSWMGCL